MLKSVLRSTAVLAMAGSAIALGAAVEPASACGVGTDNCGDTSSSGGTVTITVSGSFVGAGSAGSSGTTTVSLPTPCWYDAGYTGKEYAEWVDSGEAARLWHRTGGIGNYEPHPGYQRYKDDTEGHWYGATCSSATFEDIDDFFEFAEEWFRTHDSVYVEAGGSPPIPPVPGEVLLAAAMEAITVPDPEFVWNPQERSDNGSVVNWPTWFWLDGALPTEGSVTASAGPWSATVELSLTNVEYFSEGAGSVVCEDGGTEWTRSAGESDCTLTFPSPSDAATVEASARWDGSWSYNGAPQGAIDPLTSDWEISFPVYEIGSTVTEFE
ncbi:hypothetical protein [Nocardioides bizhenqiangii]|uniref:Uncharacterized protein n=1 Tax=Nocardioides bizhenqiangii TaxID=3095076 RepID=A0ABZ0ZTM4_9ACTN|nr:hypothetical protein [Nocardioides sp. HM61]WQQ27673.1 hypothetical protein SHK19_05410 [Nocardioides sp. HM61]